jgi:hypothetical protein
MVNMESVSRRLIGLTNRATTFLFFEHLLKISRSDSVVSSQMYFPRLPDMLVFVALMRLPGKFVMPIPVSIAPSAHILRPLGAFHWCARIFTLALSIGINIF